MSENTLFNECRACKMKFETRSQLETHVKKYCVQSEYGTQAKLEEKYQKELQALKRQQIPGSRDFPEEEQKQPSSFPTKQQYASMSVEGLRDQMQQEDAEYKRLQRLAQQRREGEMDDELNKFKDDRQKIRLKRDDDQRAFQELLLDLEQKKEKEIRARVEKDQIRRALMDLEKAKLTTIEQEKKRDLEKLIAEREALRAKENQLLDEIGTLENNTKTLDVMRKEEVDKIHNVIDGLKLKQGENKRVNEQMVVERADKVAALRLKREQLEGERLRIMDNLDKIKSGDLTSVKKGGGLNLVSNAKNILNDMKDLAGYDAGQVRDRLRNDEQKLHDVRQRHAPNGNQQMLFDPDEAYQNKMPAATYARGEYQDKYRNATTPGGLEGFRQGIERHADSMMNKTMDQSVFVSGLHDQPQQPKNYQQGPPQLQQSVGIYPPQVINQQYQQQQPQMQQVEVLRNAWGVAVPQFTNNQFLMQPNPQQQYNQWGLQAPPQNQLKQSALQVINQQNAANPAFGQFALNQMATGFNPTIQRNPKTKKAVDPWDLFSVKAEFFLQNDVRGTDLTEEERVLMSLSAQEVDAMRVLSRIPVGTELYRFKMEQYKELSTMRAEIEKIVQEQRLQDAKRDFEIERRDEDRVFENEKWVDDNRKFIIENRLRKDNTKKATKEGGYTSSQGFVIHWDYTLGLPKRTNYSQVVFGIYNGQNVIYQPRLVDPRETETENLNYNRAIYGDSHQVFEIAANPDTLMIIEVQIPFSKRVEENVGRTETYGWTQVDLFDHNKQLKRGKFKCPVYYGPTDPTITVEEIANLEPVPNCWVYFRIGYPNDKEFSNTKTIYPEQTMHEYIVPYIHLRGLFGKREAVQKKQQGNMSQSEYSMRYGNKGYKMIEETIEESELVNQTLQMGGGQQFSRQERTIQDLAPPMQDYKEEQKIETSQLEPGKKKGLRFIIYKVENYQARSHLRVMTALLEEGNLVLDDNGLPVAFNTTVHNPLDLRPESRQIPAENFITPLPSANPEYKNMSNKAKGSDIIFQEEYRIFRNLQGMFRKNKKDLWIGIQVVKKPDPVELQAQDVDTTMNNYGGLEFDILGWQFLKINEENGNILNGRFKMKIFDPPIRRPPIDQSKVKETEQFIDFSLHEFEYDDKDMEKFRKLQREVQKSVKKKKSEIPDVPLSNSPFIVNSVQQWANKPFEKRMGIDFYIDGIRFAPDKVTVCKVYMEVFSAKYEQIVELEPCNPDLKSLSYMPQFFYRRELRKEHFDPTCLALMTIVTVDKSLNETRIIGYAAINLFLNPFTKIQPENPNENDYVLYNGAYQIPVFSQQIDRTPPFNIKKIYSHEKSPCCSMLVRINQAPLSDDGLRSLSIVDFPEEKVQLQKGLLQPQPNYGLGGYNTDLCAITESEKELIPHRVLRQDITVRENVYLLLKGEQINKEMKDRELYQYIDKRLYLTRDTFMIDMMYFAKYRAQAGFKFIIDGFHNVTSTSNAYVILYSLSNPGAFYIEPRDVTQAHMTSTYDWESVGNTPQYTDEWFKFKENVNRYQNIIIDVKSVPISKVDGQITDVGWTVLPVFSPDGYIKSDIYQLPLFKGPVPSSVVEQIKKQDAWQFLQQQIKDRKVFYLEYMSTVVRLVDSQREGHFQKRFDHSRLNYSYLPEATVKKWSYNNAIETKQKDDKKMKMYIPHKDNPSAYNRKLTDYFANAYNLKQYLSS